MALGGDYSVVISLAKLTKIEFLVAVVRRSFKNSYFVYCYSHFINMYRILSTHKNPFSNFCLQFRKNYTLLLLTNLQTRLVNN